MAIQDITLYQRSDDPSKMQLKVGEQSSNTDFGYSVNTFDLTPQQFSQLKALGISVKDAGTTTYSPTSQGGQNFTGLDTAGILKQLQAYATSDPFPNSPNYGSKELKTGNWSAQNYTESEWTKKFANPVDITGLPTSGGYLYEPNKGQAMPTFRDRGASEDMTSYLKAKQAFEIQNTGKSGIDFGTAGVPTTTPTSLGTSGTTAPASTYTGVSIVDYLKSVGQASDYATRAGLAQQQGITNYTGTAEQNTQLLNKLRGGATTPPILNTGSSAIATSDQANAIDNQKKSDEQKAIQEQIAGVQKEIALKSAQLQVQQYNEQLGISAPIVPKTAPVVPNFTSTYEALRADNGVAALESQMNKLKADKLALQDSLQMGTQKIEGKLEPMELIGAEQTELTRQANERMNAIDRELNTVIDEYQTKMNVISNLMDLKKADYSTAVDAYNTAFSQNLQTQQLLEGQQDTNKANLTLIMNSLQDSGVSWNDMDTSLKNELTSLGLKAGFSTAQIQAMFSNLGSGEKQVSTTLVESASGDYYSILTKKADGTYAVSTMPTGKATTPSGTAGQVADEADKTENTRILNELTDSGKRDYVSQGYFNTIKANQTLYNSAEFDKKFGYLLKDQTSPVNSGNSTDINSLWNLIGQ